MFTKYTQYITIIQYYPLQFLLFIKFLLKLNRDCKVKIMLKSTREYMTGCLIIDLENIRYFSTTFFSIKRCSRAIKVIKYNCVKYTHGNSTTKWRFHAFFDLIPLSTCLFSLLQPLHEAEPLALNPKELVL